MFYNAATPLADAQWVARTLKLTDLLPDAGRALAYYPGLRRLAGSANATLLLCQLIYWHGKQADKDGWIRKRSRTVEDDPDGRVDPSNQSIEYETGLTYKEQITARRVLRERGFLEERSNRIEHEVHFRVNFEGLREAWGPASGGQVPIGHLTGDQREHDNLPSVTSIKGTYTDYTQTTTQKKTPPAESPDQSLTATEQAPDFPVTPAEAMEHPDIRLFQQACGRIPGSSQYRTVIETMRHFRQMHGPATVEHLRPFWLAWSSRKRLSDGQPYDPASLTWLTEWALNGAIPPQKGQTDGTLKPPDAKEQTLGPTDLSAARRINRRLRKARLPSLRRARLPAEGRASHRP
ncbi:MAG: hypothetical protein ACK2T0_10025 [Anaerolineales bacterium]